MYFRYAGHVLIPLRWLQNTCPLHHLTPLFTAPASWMVRCDTQDCAILLRVVVSGYDTAIWSLTKEIVLSIDCFITEELQVYKGCKLSRVYPLIHFHVICFNVRKSNNSVVSPPGLWVCPARSSAYLREPHLKNCSLTELMRRSSSGVSSIRSLTCPSPFYRTGSRGGREERREGICLMVSIINIWVKELIRHYVSDEMSPSFAY